MPKGGEEGRTTYLPRGKKGGGSALYSQLTRGRGHPLPGGRGSTKKNLDSHRLIGLGEKEISTPFVVGAYWKLMGGTSSTGKEKGFPRL